MVTAICLQCGAAKDKPWRRCSVCGFNPEGDTTALVRSVYLSTGRFKSARRRKQYEQELELQSVRIKNGETVEFDASELDRLARQHQRVSEVPMSAVWGALFRLFLPGIGLLFLIFAVNWLLRSLLEK